MLSSEEWGRACERAETIVPYMDRRLRSSRALYEQFVKDLYDRGMLRFTTRPADLVTPFFVQKKNGKQRLVLDCRITNRRLKPAAPMASATGATWASLELPDHQQLYIAQSDLNKYFYHLAIPESLSEYFCLPPVRGSLLRELVVPRSRIAGSPGPFDNEQVWPMLGHVAREPDPFSSGLVGLWGVR